MRASTTLTMLAACGLAACNPSAFNSLLDRAPVVSFSPGGSSTSSLAVLPLPFPTEPGTTSAARMLLSVRDQTRLAVADFDLNGKVTLTAPTDTELGKLAGYPAYSMAVRADNKIILGTPKAGGGPTPVGGASTLDLIPTGGGGYTFSIQNVPAVLPIGDASTRHGIAVAAGNITAIPQPGNFVVIGDSTVQVLDATGTAIAAATPLGCPTVASTSAELYPYRPVAVGDVLAGGFEEIVLGLPPNVVFVQWDGTSTLPCPPPSKSLTMSASLSFGTSVTIGDFNGDGYPDLAVGNPPDTVYVFFAAPDGGSLDALVAAGPNPIPSVTIKSAAATGFGQRIATYHLPGQAVDQLLVADPGATVNGRQGAGKVMLFSPNGQLTRLADTNALVTIFDATAGSDPGLFGLGLGGVQFNPQLCVPSAVQLMPWASNGPNLLTFFNYVGAGQDPRCFVLKP